MIIGEKKSSFLLSDIYGSKYRNYIVRYSYHIDDFGVINVKVDSISFAKNTARKRALQKTGAGTTILGKFISFCTIREWVANKVAEAYAKHK